MKIVIPIKSTEVDIPTETQPLDIYERRYIVISRWVPSRAWRLAGYAALLMMLAGLVMALYG